MRMSGDRMSGDWQELTRLGGKGGKFHLVCVQGGK